MPPLSRRDFLKLIGAGAVAATAGGALGRRLRDPSQIARLSSTPSPWPGTPEVEIALTAAQDEVPLWPGAPTQVWRYRGAVLQGPSAALQTLPASYLGPIVRVRRGQRIRVHFSHQLPEETIVHWHGLHVPERDDGHPRWAIPAGRTYTYDFTVLDRAGTYWFHPHPHGRTGPQVYRGMAGLFLVSDAEEEALGLPSGAYDLPLVLQDRRFDEANQLLYLDRGRMAPRVGFLGDTILVNGTPEFTLSVATRPYRLRLLNGSNARIYKLAWAHGVPLTVIGTDGGLLDAPVQKDVVTLAPAQRVELWVDFGRYPVGTQLQMLSLPHGAPGGNASFPVFTVAVERKAAGGEPLPASLTALHLERESEAVNAGHPRTFALTGGMGRGWAINGRTFEMTAVAPDEVVRLGDLEVWRLVNRPRGRGGGMGGGNAMNLPHPMHVHDLQFQILRRKVNPAWRSLWETLAPGFVDQGWHDTVVVMPGEQVDLLLKFRDFQGLFLYHCHNLEHEDRGMMRNYRVVA